MSDAKDQKEAFGNARKPDLSHVRRSLMNHIARACDYGGYKGYERGNFLRDSGSVKANLERVRGYLTANLRHTTDVLDAIEMMQASNPTLEDWAAVCDAVGTPDLDAPAGKEPSYLPHLAGMAASVMLAIEVAYQSGMIEQDPGTPWVDAEWKPEPVVFSESDRPDLVFPKRREGSI